MDVSKSLDEVISLLDIAISEPIVNLLKARKSGLERLIFNSDKTVIPTPRLYDEAWDMLRRERLARDGYTCQGCGVSATKQNIHHIIPLERGGSNDLSNLTTLCNNCHARIHPWLLDGAA